MRMSGQACPAAAPARGQLCRQTVEGHMRSVGNRIEQKKGACAVPNLGYDWNHEIEDFGVSTAHHADRRPAWTALRFQPVTAGGVTRPELRTAPVFHPNTR